MRLSSLLAWWLKRGGSEGINLLQGVVPAMAWLRRRPRVMRFSSLFLTMAGLLLAPLADVQAAWLTQVPQQLAQPASRHDDPYFERTRPLTAVSRNGREFLTAFNAAADRPRVVAVLSPTDPRAREEAARLARLLQSEPDSDTVVLAVWIPHDPADSPANALRATGLLTDSRVTHFHDLHSFVKRSLEARLDSDAAASPALLLHYAPGTLWLDLPPLPDRIHTPASTDRQ
ncbi:MAG TPA: hypothetical protein VLV83_15135 [Acidobacteriota bacterium]|nr:hypothetical protein [Acidobacteriota bacterium]